MKLLHRISNCLQQNSKSWSASVNALRFCWISCVDGSLVTQASKSYSQVAFDLLANHGQHFFYIQGGVCMNLYTSESYVLPDYIPEGVQNRTGSSMIGVWTYKIRDRRSSSLWRRRVGCHILWSVYLEDPWMRRPSEGAWASNVVAPQSVDEITIWPVPHCQIWSLLHPSVLLL